MTSTPELFVVSDVGRDLLQSAGLFKQESKVVWEYVANSLQYVQPGIRARVDVRIDNKKKRIVIRDNGRGMSMSDLGNFFVMHGENADRLSGNGGRGLFGTGKSAAFAIADRLTVTTVRHKRRSKVRLTREAIQQQKAAREIPIEVLESEVACDSENGTIIEIDDVNLDALQPKRVTQFIERHLSRWPQNGTVTVNDVECKYEPPTHIESRTLHPNPAQLAILGDCALVLKVAAQPLDEDRRGVMITSKGVLHEVTLAGNETKELANYIFGEIEVPALDDDRSAIAPFDMSRSGELRRENLIVRAVIGFISEHVEKLRKELVTKEKVRRQEEEDKKLQRQADEIARIINQDFAAFREATKQRRARAPGAIDASRYQETFDGGADVLVSGNDAHAVATEFKRPEVSGGEKGQGGSRNMQPQPTPGESNDPIVGKYVHGKTSDSTPPNGGFGIKFRALGEGEDRAAYSKNEREIVINLDHPQMRAARGHATEQEVTFKRLAYEIAFSEYAIALAYERAEADDLSDLVDAITEIRRTVNRVARRAAHLYGSAT